MSIIFVLLDEIFIDAIASIREALKQAEKLKSHEIKEGWMKNDEEWWIGWMKDEGWRMKEMEIMTNSLYPFIISLYSLSDFTMLCSSRFSWDACIAMHWCWVM